MKCLILLILLFVSEISFAESDHWTDEIIENPGYWNQKRINEYSIELNSSFAKEKSEDILLIILEENTKEHSAVVREILNNFLKINFPHKIRVVHFFRKDNLFRHYLSRIDATAIKAILSVGDLSYDLFASNEHLQRAPIITVSTKDPVSSEKLRSYEHKSQKIVYLSKDLTPEILLKFSKQILRDFDHLIFFFEDSAYNRSRAKALENIGLAKELDLEFLFFDSQKFDISLKTKALRRIKGQDANKKFVFLFESNNQSYLESLKKRFPQVPVLGLATDLAKAGKKSAFASVSVSAKSNASLATSIASQIFSGEKQPEDFPVQFVYPPDISFNFHSVRVHNLKVPFPLFEIAHNIYDYEGKKVKGD